MYDLIHPVACSKYQEARVLGPTGFCSAESGSCSPVTAPKCTSSCHRFLYCIFYCDTSVVAQIGVFVICNKISIAESLFK